MISARRTRFQARCIELTSRIKQIHHADGAARIGEFRGIGRTLRLLEQSIVEAAHPLARRFEVGAPRRDLAQRQRAHTIMIVTCRQQIDFGAANFTFVIIIREQRNADTDTKRVVAEITGEMLELHHAGDVACAQRAREIAGLFRRRDTCARRLHVSAAAQNFFNFGARSVRRRQRPTVRRADFRSVFFNTDCVSKLRLRFQPVCLGSARIVLRAQSINANARDVGCRYIAGLEPLFDGIDGLKIGSRGFTRNL